MLKISKHRNLLKYLCCSFLLNCCNGLSLAVTKVYSWPFSFFVIYTVNDFHVLLKNY